MKDDIGQNCGLTFICLLHTVVTILIKRCSSTRAKCKKMCKKNYKNMTRHEGKNVTSTDVRCNGPPYICDKPGEKSDVQKCDRHSRVGLVNIVCIADLNLTCRCQQVRTEGVISVVFAVV